MAKQLSSYSLDPHVSNPSQNSTSSSLANLANVVESETPDQLATLEVAKGFDRGIFTFSLNLDPYSDDLKFSRRRTLLIVVADRSGSMAGSPWRQVQEALTTIIQDSLENQNVKVEIIVYNGHAEHVPWTPENFQTRISGISAQGMTCFSSAFDSTLQLIDRHLHSEEFSQIIIGFMTDGNHTVKSTDPEQAKTNFHSKLLSYSTKFRIPIIIHTIGFTESHQYHFLDDLRKKGTEAGSFQYSDNSDTPGTLMGKIRQLFDIASQSMGEVYLKLENDDLFPTPMNFSLPLLSTGGIELESWLPVGPSLLQFVANPITSETPIETTTTTTTNSSMTFAELRAQRRWERSERKKREQKKITFSVHWTVTNKKNEQRVSGDLQCDLIRADANFSAWSCKMIGDEIEKFSAEFLTRFSSQTTPKVNDSELAGWSAQLTSWQTRLDAIVLDRVNKDDKEKLSQTKAEVQSKVDALYAVLADLSRGQVNQTAILGRVNDLRYAAVFKKARRQRKMNQRAQKNAGFANKVERELLALVFPDEDSELLTRAPGLVVEPDLTRLTTALQISQEFFNCMMSLMDWAELIREERDALGFGLAIKRSDELVVDEPTNAIQVLELGSTFLSRKEFNHAMKHSIDLIGHLRSHGGIGLQAGQDPASSALSGTGREPINAWMPLYINHHHWQVVKLLLPTSLGYFCTLDHLGYASSQLNVLFMLLGRMIVDLSYEPGEHQLRTLFAFCRTCFATAHDFQFFRQQFTGDEKDAEVREQYMKLIVEYVDNFIRGPEFRLKDRIPNLLTLVGYFTLLDVDHLSTDNQDSSFSKTQLFWLALIQEYLRRGAEYTYWLEEGQYKRGNDGRDPLSPTAFLDQVLCTPDENEPSEIQQILFSGETNYHGENDNFLRAILQPTEDSKRLAPFNLTSATAMMQLENTFNNPKVEGLLKIYTFISEFHKLQQSQTSQTKLQGVWSTLDLNAGIVPDAWLNQMKTAFHQLKVMTTSNKPTISLLLQTVTNKQGRELEQYYRALTVQAMRTRKSGWARSAIEKGAYFSCLDEKDQRTVFNEAIHDLEMKRVAMISEEQNRQVSEKKSRTYRDREAGIHRVLKEGPTRLLGSGFTGRLSYGVVQAILLSPWGPYASLHSG